MINNDVHDHSEVDKFFAAQRKAIILNALWKPLLAGSVAALATSAAVYVAMPKFITREVVVEHVVQKDVAMNIPIPVPQDKPFDNYTPQNKSFDNFIPNAKSFDVPTPRIATPPTAVSPPTAVAPSPPTDNTPTPRTKAEQKFEETPDWHNGVVKGRILRSQENGFVLMTDDHSETSFFPAKVGGNGSPENDPTRKDLVEEFIGDLTTCAKNQSSQMFQCTILHAGTVVNMPVVPNSGEPT